MTAAGTTARTIGLTAAAALVAASAAAQTPPGSGKGAYVGGSAGVYFESAEGNTGHALAGSAIFGYRFGARWAMQGEVGGMGDVYCREATLSWENPHRETRETVCHRDPIFTVDAVRRFTAGRLRPYVAFGLGIGAHVGLGAEIPVGGRFAIVPGVDVNVLPDMLAVRPKVAMLVRF
jgi:hypothetical protein